MQVRETKCVDATTESVAPFGVLVRDDITQSLDIPYYLTGAASWRAAISVFHYSGQACLRTAKVLPAEPDIDWLERRLELTQLFVGLGTEPFVMVLDPPNHDEGKDLPDLDKLVALRFPASSALLLHRGTWHDFPLAITKPVTLLIANSEEVVNALRNAGRPRELNEGDAQGVVDRPARRAPATGLVTGPFPAFRWPGQRRLDVRVRADLSPGVPPA